MLAWAKFPTRWILQTKLNLITWKEHKSDGIAALLVLIALAVKRNRDQIKGPPEDDVSMVKATYDDIQELVAISRSKVANGLGLLLGLEIIERLKDNRSHYRIVGLDVGGAWGKLPQDWMMQKTERISVFEPFNLRSKSELDALKLYLLMVAFRDSKSGYAIIGYEKITGYTGVNARYIKKAKSHLISLELIHVDLDHDAINPPLRYTILGL
ncbi:MAG: hypothetical protein NTY36_14745 [Deltaproteobacteria bacterium]|nr:hypothetical protein [Deltaproteobacteria bacterium]